MRKTLALSWSLFFSLLAPFARAKLANADSLRASGPDVQTSQEPVKPYPYLEEDVRFENRSGSVRFAGSLTKPGNGGRFPAVLLVAGAGPQDRDENIVGPKTCLWL